MFSRSAAYAIQVMSCLARNYPNEPLKLDQLSVDTGIPRHSVVKVVQAMHKRRLLSTSRGSQGGVSLKKPPQGIMLSEVVCAVDGPPKECPNYENAESCLKKIECPLLRRWEELAQQALTLRLSRDLQSFVDRNLQIDYYS